MCKLKVWIYVKLMFKNKFTMKNTLFVAGEIPINLIESNPSKAKAFAKVVDETNIYGTNRLECLINEVGNKNPIIYYYAPNPNFGHDLLPLLHYAAMEGKDKSFVEVSGGLTIKNPPMLSKTYFNRWTPMHWAANGDHTTVIGIISKMDGCNVNTKAANGHTPLHWAALNGQLSSVKCLIEEFNADPKIKDNDGGTAYGLARNKAVRKNYHECAEYLQQYN